MNNLPPSSHRGEPAPDPSLQTSQNLNYLLEDEDREQESGSGAWKYVLMVLALGLAVGLGYLRWSGQGFAGLISSPTKPSASSSSGASPSAAKPAAAPSTSDAGATQTAVPDGTAPAGGGAGADAANPAPGAAVVNPSSTQPAQAVDQTSPPAAATGDAASNPTAPGAAAAPAASDQPVAAEPAAKPAPKPKPKPPAGKPVDPVVLAEKFIFGRGAPQNCDRGMSMLRPSAAKGNPKAMISLGTLYSTGVCVPRDLPTAYHWLALALRKQPDDQPLQENMQKLWSEMTQPERQLAIRLSQ